MQNYTIAETYTLPSKGRVYSSQVAPDVKIRSMTTMEEMRRLAPSELPYKNMCDIIDDCIVSELGISSYDMCLGDYLFLLHKLRSVTYGKVYKMTTTCPYCGTPTTVEVDLDSLEIKEYNDEDLDRLSTFVLPQLKKKVTIHMQTPRTLDEIATEVKEYRKRNTGSSIDPTMIITMEKIIDTVDGKKPDIINLREWVKNLPMADTNAILQHSDALNSCVGVETNIEVDCPTCTLNFLTSFKATNEFFRPALDI